MNTTARSTMVGLTVLIALVVFGWMLVHFGGRSAEFFSRPQMAIRLVADRADGLAEGSAINYLGVNVGRITSLSLDTTHQGVTMEGVIDTVPGIPDNVIGHVRPQSYISSGAAVSLEADGAPSATVLQPNSTVKTEYVGNVLFPKEFTDAADQARQFIDEIHKSHVVEDLDGTIVTMKEQLVKAGKAIDSIEQVTGNPQLQSDLVAAVDSIRKSADTTEEITANLQAFTSKDLPKLSDHLDQTFVDADKTVTSANDSIARLTRDADDRLEKVDKLLEQTTQIAAKVNSGQGTAGELINDPKLYANLVETTNQLNATIADLKRVVEEWEVNGVPLKLK